MIVMDNQYCRIYNVFCVWHCIDIHPLKKLEKKLGVLFFSKRPEGIVIFWLYRACGDKFASGDIPAQRVTICHVKGEGVVGRDG